jgi:hypothetical protein
MKRRNFLALAFAPALSRLAPKTTPSIDTPAFLGVGRGGGRSYAPFFIGEGDAYPHRKLVARIRVTDEALSDLAFSEAQLRAAERDAHSVLHHDVFLKTENDLFRS